MTTKRIPITDRAEWLELRKPFVTASQVPALFGCHPYLTALKLYMEKSGVEFPNPESKLMRRGRLFESAVGAAVADERPEWKIVAAKEFLADTTRRMGATPDFYIDCNDRGRGVLQAKTVSRDQFANAWDNGKAVPFWIQLQMLDEMMLSGVAWGVVAALVIDPYDPACAIFEQERHEGAEKRIVDAVAKFWQDVEQGNQPKPDYGRDAELIKILAPRERRSDAVVDLSGNNELPAMLEERELLKARIKVDDERCKAIEAQLKFMMRDAAVAIGLPDWRITFITGTVQGYSVPTREQRTLRIRRKNGKD
jgi:predicted phage-related endonuclease